MSFKLYKPKTLTKNVTVAGVRERVSNTRGAIVAFDLSMVAKDTNTGAVYVGGDDVSSSDTPFSANDSLSFTPTVVQDSKEYGIDLYNVWVDSAVSGDGWYLTYTVLDERIL